MKKIIIIIGTRPEAIKLLPLFFFLKEDFVVQLVSTGQHRQMLDQIFEFFNVRPTHALNVMVENQSLAGITSSLFSSIDKILLAESPDLVIVQGDTTTAMVGAMAAYYHRIPVAHVEAGLRTHNKYSPFPEEINRTIISQISELNFAPTPRAAENLVGFRNVHVVGNTIVDSLHLALKRIERRNVYEARFQFLADGRDMVLVTAHRRESFGKALQNICEAIRILSAQYPEVRFVYPVHLNPLVRGRVHTILGDIPSISLIDPLNYDEMVYLMTCAKLILTDSGGIQEEAPAIGVPLIVLRDTTERPEGIAAGCAILSGTQTEGIVKAFESVYGDPELYRTMASAGNPYGDGHSAERIATIIRDFL